MDIDAIIHDEERFKWVYRCFFSSFNGLIMNKPIFLILTNGVIREFLRFHSTLNWYRIIILHPQSSPSLRKILKTNGKIFFSQCWIVTRWTRSLSLSQSLFVDCWIKVYVYRIDQIMYNNTENSNYRFIHHQTLHIQKLNVMWLRWRSQSMYLLWMKSGHMFQKIS